VTLDALLERFEHRKAVSGGFMVRCPAHADDTASLSVSAGKDGRTLLHCHAGCDSDAILSALGLSLADLFPPRDRGGLGDPTAIYDYRDEQGALIFQSLRYPVQSDGNKTFRQRRPDGAGGWIWKLDETRRVLYHLPRLKGKEAVMIVEGEKDADRLWSLHVPATTNAGGAGKWREDYTESLKASGVRRVVVLPDNDEPGEKHAIEVARSCHAAGLSVKLVRLPGLTPKGDVSDWLEAGHAKDELLAVIKSAAPFDSNAAPAPVASAPLLEHLKTALGRVMDDLTSDQAPQVCPTPFPALNYYLNGGFSPGELIYLGARPAIGKSSIALDIARRASLRGPVLIVSREMLNAAVARRLLSQEGHIRSSALKRKDLSQPESGAAVETVGRLGDRPIWLTDRAVTIDEIAKLVARPPAAPWVLVVIDYLQLVRAPKHVTEHRLALEHVSQNLKALALRHSVPVLCLSSLSRPQAGTNAEPTLASLRESGELEHDADVVLLMHRKNDQDTTVQMRIAKNRDGQLGVFELAFIGEYVTFEELAKGVA
jgi:hypothetical protein